MTDDEERCRRDTEEAVRAAQMVLLEEYGRACALLKRLSVGDHGYRKVLIIDRYQVARLAPGENGFKELAQFARDLDVFKAKAGVD